MTIETSHIKGSEKQINWSKSIIADNLGHVNAQLIGELMGKAGITAEQYAKLNITTPADAEAYTENLVNEFVKTQSQAGWWIENQHHVNRLFREFAKDTFKSL